MSRALALLLLALLVAPAAAAQMPARIVEVAAPGSDMVVIGGGLFATFNVETARAIGFQYPWLAVGHDNILNLTVFNHEKLWWNATFSLNVTGATLNETELAFSVAPGASQTRLVAAHPEETGRVRVVAVSDTDGTQGAPLMPEIDLPAIPPVAITFLDPPPMPEAFEEDGVTYRVEGQGGYRPPGTHFARIQPGVAIVPRVEVHNPLDTAIAGFELVLRGQDNELGRVRIDGLEARQRRVVEFPEYVPVQDTPDFRFGGIRGHFQIVPEIATSVGGLSVRAGGATFRLDAGAVRNVVPTVAWIEVHSGIALDVLVPEKVGLGIPMRLRVNATNLGGGVQAGTVVLSIQTPYNLHYGIQGPETRSMHVRLEPGQTEQMAVELTPRVTGRWYVSSHFQGGEGYSYGFGGSSFLIPSPVRIAVDHVGTVYARLNEPVSVDVRVSTDEVLENAELRIATRAGGMYSGAEGETGTIVPGLAHRLVATTSGGGSLGTLVPGAASNTTFQIVSGASGRYTVVPFVVAGGFVYTDPGNDGVPSPYVDEVRSTSFDVAVQSRIIPTAWAVAPLTLAVVVFVGTWTLRTRFVR